MVVRDISSLIFPSAQTLGIRGAGYSRAKYPDTNHLGAKHIGAKPINANHTHSKHLKNLTKLSMKARRAGSSTMVLFHSRTAGCHC